MAFENPTALFVGARGTLHGWTASVVGRVVLGVEIDGERYYWNEYHLVDSAGNSGTLVYEEGEDGPEWKFFELLTPARPLTVDEAAGKKVGDQVSFGGASLPVTLVDRSRVYFIEGRAPEGVEVGDLADFLNADAGDHMIVASWTGNEIEFYEGRDVPAAAIARAFGVTLTPPGQAGPAAGAMSSFRGEDAAAPDTGRSGMRRYVNIALSALAMVVALSWNSCSPSCRSSGPGATATTPRKQPASAVRLANGASGTLAGKTFAVGGQALVEVGRISGRYDRREYRLSALRDDALLVNGLTGGLRQWHLLESVTPPVNFQGYEAAEQRKGSTLNVAGTVVTVTELFRSDLRSAEGAPGGALPEAGRQYGFVGTSGGEWWLARWTERGLSLHRGKPVEEKDVLAAFGPGGSGKE